MQLEFLQWVTLYHGVLTNLYGEDRDAAVQAMDNDAEFDRWMAAYERKMAAERSAASRPRGAGGAQAPRGKVSKEEFLNRMGAVHE